MFLQLVPEVGNLLSSFDVVKKIENYCFPFKKTVTQQLRDETLRVEKKCDQRNGDIENLGGLVGLEFVKGITGNLSTELKDEAPRLFAKIIKEEKDKEDLEGDGDSVKVTLKTIKKDLDELKIIVSQTAQTYTGQRTGNIATTADVHN